MTIWNVRMAFFECDGKIVARICRSLNRTFFLEFLPEMHPEWIIGIFQ